VTATHLCFVLQERHAQQNKTTTSARGYTIRFM